MAGAEALRLREGFTMMDSVVAEFEIRTYLLGEEEKMAALVNQGRTNEEGPVTVDMIRNEWTDSRLKLDRDTFVAVNNTGDYIAVAEVWFNDPDNDEAVITRHLGFAMHPDYRERHPEVMDEVLERAMHHARTFPLARPNMNYVLRAWAAASDSWKQQKIESLGFHLSHIGYTMLFEAMDSLPPVPEVQGVTLTDWTEERDPDLWEALNDSFITDKSFVRLSWEEWQDLYHGPRSRPDLWRLAVDATTDRVVGLALTEIDHEVNTETGRHDGWIVDLAVRPEWRSYGVGRSVMLGAMAALRDAGMTAVKMGIDSYEPAQATQLYEALGFQVLKGSHTYLQPLVRPAE